MKTIQVIFPRAFSIRQFSSTDFTLAADEVERLLRVGDSIDQMSDSLLMSRVADYLVEKERVDISGVTLERAMQQAKMIVSRPTASTINIRSRASFGVPSCSCGVPITECYFPKCKPPSDGLTAIGCGCGRKASECAGPLCDGWVD